VNEKRRRTRKRPEMALAVTDAMTGAVVGSIGNLSQEGMLLLAERPIAEDALYQFQFDLPDTQGRPYRFEVGAHELWSEAASSTGRSWVGFRFIDLGPEDARVLAAWLADDADTDT
jgi:hypothetical protein